MRIRYTLANHKTREIKHGYVLLKRGKEFHQSHSEIKNKIINGPLAKIRKTNSHWYLVGYQPPQKRSQS